MKEPKHAMIDLETMHTTPDAAIVSVGVILFDPRFNYVAPKSKGLYFELDWKNQGRTIDQSCITNFWDKQPSTVRQALLGSYDLEEVLFEIDLFLPKDCKVWGNGATFDISMLEDAYRQFDMEVPWKFWNIRDQRTIKDMYDSVIGSFGKDFKGVPHNALDDAYNQAKDVCAMWRAILAGN